MIAHWLDAYSEDHLLKEVLSSRRETVPKKKRAKKRRAWVRERGKPRQGVRSGNGKREKLKKRGQTIRHKKEKKKNNPFLFIT